MPRRLDLLTDAELRALLVARPWRCDQRDEAGMRCLRAVGHTGLCVFAVRSEAPDA